jgi:SnoaL-like polyketide cyclase
MVAEGDKAVTRFTARGTHQGETEDFGPPTGNRMELAGISILRFAEGKIVEGWLLFRWSVLLVPIEVWQPEWGGTSPKWARFVFSQGSRLS